ncbi:MAG: phosphoribosyltransferase family protein [Antricoccus sp.]
MLRTCAAAVGGLVRDLGDLMLPQRCVGCGAPGHALCPWCIERAHALELRYPEPVPEGFAPCVAFGDYDDVLQRAIIAVKERGRRELVRPLGDLLADAVQAIVAVPGAVIVPVPSTRAAARVRGGDHMLRIARSTARELNRRTEDRWPVIAALATTASSLDATHLNRTERLASRAHSFTGRRGSSAALHRRHVVIVDDVVTTGATLSAVANVLRDLGALSVNAATIAATRRTSNR